jgi:hypothetical protein
VVQLVESLSFGRPQRMANCWVGLPTFGCRSRSPAGRRCRVQPARWYRLRRKRRRRCGRCRGWWHRCLSSRRRCRSGSRRRLNKSVRCFRARAAISALCWMRTHSSEPGSHRLARAFRPAPSTAPAARHPSCQLAGSATTRHMQRFPRRATHRSDAATNPARWSHPGAS